MKTPKKKFDNTNSEKEIDSDLDSPISKKSLPDEEDDDFDSLDDLDGFDDLDSLDDDDDF